MALASHKKQSIRNAYESMTREDFLQWVIEDLTRSVLHGVSSTWRDEYLLFILDEGMVLHG